MDTPPDPDIYFRRNELFSNSSTKPEPWQQQYRGKDILLGLNPKGKEKIRRSFERYRFNHPSGMLQYLGLPEREFQHGNDPLTGLTGFYELSEIGRFFKSRVFVKNEAQNPSGCFKDRETLMCLLKSRNGEKPGAVIFSSGNAAISAAIYTQDKPTRLIAFVPGDTYPEKIESIREHGSDIVVVGDEKTGFETGFRLYCQMKFSNPGPKDWSVRNPYRVLGDKTIALEIVKQFQHNNGPASAPDYVIAPTANGSCLAGIWKGFKELYALKIIDSLPKMVSAGIKKASPVYKAVQQKQTQKPICCDPSKVSKENSHIGSIIVAEEGYDSMQAAKAVLESGGAAVEVGWKDIQQSLELLLGKEEKKVCAHQLLPEPASLTALAAVEKIKPKPSVNMVLIHTGMGIKGEKKLLELFDKKSSMKKNAINILERQRKKSFPKAQQKGERINCKANVWAMEKAFARLMKK